MAKRLAPSKSGIGFRAEPVDVLQKPELEEPLNGTQPDDLRHFGRTLVFIGRFTVLVPWKRWTKLRSSAYSTCPTMPFSGSIKSCSPTKTWNYISRPRRFRPSPARLSNATPALVARPAFSNRCCANPCSKSHAYAASGTASSMTSSSTERRGRIRPGFFPGPESSS